MIDFPRLKAEILRTGHVGEQHLDRLCEALYSEGRLDSEIVEFLASIRAEARSVCRSFEQLFAELVSYNVLINGSISPERAIWLRQVLFANGAAGESDKKLLWELKRQTKQVCPEFRKLYDECIG